MRTKIVKRSVVINGHKTSVSLEDAFWESVRAIAKRDAVSVSQLVERIDQSREHANLSSAIRLFVLGHYRAASAAAPEAAGRPDASAAVRRTG